jgi:hypothetical protein
MAITVDLANATRPGAFSGSEAVVPMEIPIELDASYVTGGYSLTVEELFGEAGCCNFIAMPSEAVIAARTSMRMCVYDVANETLQVFDEAYAEIAGTTDLSTFTCYLKVLKY